MIPCISRRLLLALILTTLFACNSGKDKQPAGDSAATIALSSAPALKDELFIRHRVNNYDNWRRYFNTDSSERLAAGIHDHIIGRGAADTNDIMLIFFMDDTAKAKSFSTNPRLKDLMQKAGVNGKPEIDYIHRVMTDTSTTAETNRVLVKHQIKDWDAWKKVFDEDKPNRIAAGLADRMVGHAINDNHSVLLVMVVNNPAKASIFMDSKALAEKMKEGGVVGKPEIFFYRVVEKR